MTVPGSSETAARRTLGRAAAADFAREAAAFAAGGRTPDWLAWSHRLASALNGLLTALDQQAYSKPLPVTCKLSDGSGCLAPADLAVVLAALTDATLYATAVVERPDDTDAYRRIAQSLGASPW